MKPPQAAPSWAELPIIGLNHGDEYDVDAWTPNAEGQLDAFRVRSDEVRAMPGLDWQTVPYADDPLAVADVFRPSASPARGTIVFVHGGYWKGKGRPNRAFLAPAWNAAGVQWINLGYPVAPDASMPEICRLTTEAIHALLEDRAPFAGTPGPVVLSGNSAGAHLVAQALTRPLGAAASRRLAGCMLLSGLYELEPLLPLPSREWLRLDAGTAARLSPMRHAAPALAAPVMVAVGQDEPSAFLGQSRLYAQHLLGHSPVDYLEVGGHNHLSIITTLASPEGTLGRHMAGWLKLAGHPGR